jgi:hypothetical protein
MNQQHVAETTKRWIADVVIGLNLCPFAQRVFKADTIRYAVSEAKDESALLNDLADELKFLVATDIARVETTVLIHPHTLNNFLDYNDFLSAAEQQIEDLRLQGIIQIASFHPDYQFADTAKDAVENYTNRSPYPMLHLLREESVSAVAHNPGELLEIPQGNIETLRRLGREQILQMLKDLG